MTDNSEALMDGPAAVRPAQSPLTREAILVERLRNLHDLLTDRFDSFDLHASAYLKAGISMFGADSGMLLRLRFLHDDAVIEAREGPLGEQIATFDQDVEWCASIIEQKKTIVQNNFSVKLRAMAYNGFAIRGYLCSPVFVGGQIYGVLCFFKAEANQSFFTREDEETIDYMAKGVAKMIELQKVQPIEPDKMRGGFATEGIKSFEEYVQQARLPEVYGVPGRVVEVLQKRIGKSSLSIDFIAEEMNLSKRTLQRRLQQQCISFAQLRDQVRFHHSINLLIEHTMSIDSISASLDFSDRTSFTNAFKRWTGLSPSTFRKLFRDYA